MVISTFMFFGYKDYLYFSSAETSVTDPMVSSVYKGPVIEASHSVVHEEQFLGY
jgi:hypothetical protein